MGFIKFTFFLLGITAQQPIPYGMEWNIGVNQGALESKFNRHSINGNIKYWLAENLIIYTHIYA